MTMTNTMTMINKMINTMTMTNTMTMINTMTTWLSMGGLPFPVQASLSPAAFSRSLRRRSSTWQSLIIFTIESFH